MARKPKTYKKSSTSKRTLTRASKSPGRGMRDASARPSSTTRSTRRSPRTRK